MRYQVSTLDVLAAVLVVVLLGYALLVVRSLLLGVIAASLVVIAIRLYQG